MREHVFSDEHAFKKATISQSLRSLVALRPNQTQSHLTRHGRSKRTCANEIHDRIGHQHVNDLISKPEWTNVVCAPSIHFWIVKNGVISKKDMALRNCYEIFKIQSMIFGDLLYLFVNNITSICLALFVFPSYAGKNLDCSDLSLWMTRKTKRNMFAICFDESFVTATWRNNLSNRRLGSSPHL